MKDIAEAVGNAMAEIRKGRGAAPAADPQPGSGQANLLEDLVTELVHRHAEAMAGDQDAVAAMRDPLRRLVAWAGEFRQNAALLTEGLTELVAAVKADQPLGTERPRGDAARPPAHSTPDGYPPSWSNLSEAVKADRGGA